MSDHPLTDRFFQNHPSKPVLMLPKGFVYTEPKPPRFGYPKFYAKEYRTWRNFHVFRMPLWYWIKSAKNWAKFRSWRCWKCGRGFGWFGTPYNAMTRKYASHKECVVDPTDGGELIHPEIADALRIRFTGFNDPWEKANDQ